jgi:conjugal transfer/entry exclusion protein
VPIGLPNRPAGFSQIMKLAELMRDPRQHFGHRLPDGLLAIADDPYHRQALQARHRALQQGPQVISARGQQAARLQHLTGQHLPHDPEHFMTLVRL